MWLINANFDCKKKLGVWKLLGPHITELNIMYLTIDRHNFSAIFDNVPNITSLKISECKVHNDYKIKMNSGTVYEKLEKLILDPINSDKFKAYLDSACPNIRIFHNSHGEEFHFNEKKLPDFISLADAYEWDELYQRVSECDMQFEILKMNNKYKQILQYRDDIMIGMFRRQQNLRCLDMVFLRSGLFEIIANFLVNVEKMKYIAHYTSAAILTKDFSKLSNLMELELTHICNFPRNFIIHFGWQPNPKMSKLTICQGIQVTLESLKSLTTCFPHLTRLELKVYNTEAFRLILENLLELVELKLRMRVDRLELKMNNSMRLTKLQNLTLLSDITNYLSDEILIEGFKFPNLKMFTASQADNVTDEGFRSFVKNCPAIENLHIEMPNLTDQAIGYLAESLPNLSHLHITQLEKLTDKCIDYIIEKCHNLRHLNLDSELYNRNFIKLFALKKLRCTGCLKFN